MSRKKGDLVGTLAALPWPVGIVVGLAGFAAVRYGMPALLKGNMFAPVLAAPIQIMPWLLLGAGVIGSLLSVLGRRQRRQMLDAQSGIDSIAALNWRQFEQLIGEAFRRQGYAIEETGLGGADGGIDLILRKDGIRVLVQCKQWRRRQVPVNVVREMVGLLAHHNADAVKIVCVGHFTRDAQQFAQGKRVELISGDDLIRMIRAVQKLPPQTASVSESVAPALPVSASSDVPTCPRCGMGMVERSNRKTGQRFWGCSTFPACRDIR